MRETEKVIFIRNAVETLGYFSEQLALAMGQYGFEVWFVDYDALYETVGGLPRFLRGGRTWLVTFNFIGLRGEEIFLGEDGRPLWERYGVQCLNILVDHPFYFHAGLAEAPPWMKVFCVDREHVAYIRRFYPAAAVSFLPLAGNIWVEQPCVETCADPTGSPQCKTAWAGQPGAEEALPEYGARRYDLVFTGNYVPPEVVSQKIGQLDPEYQEFYRGIVADLAADPGQSVDAVMERHLERELGALSLDEKRTAMAGMAVLDLYLRTSFRGEIIAGLAEAGLKIHVFGADWDRLSCRKSCNIIKNGRKICSSDCLLAIRNARISLNILPWFKDGAHDRIFTSMLQKTVALTDDSRYLREEFADGEELVFFSLREREKLPELVFSLLGDLKRAARIAENGYLAARQRHTWQSRAACLVMQMRGEGR